MKTTTAATCALLLTILAGGPSAALTIDDFESGPFSVVDDTSSASQTSAEQSGLPASSVVGNVRLTTVGASSGTFTASLTTTPGDDSLVLSSTGSGTANLFYDGSAGSATRALGLDLSAFSSIKLTTAATAAGASVRAYLYDSDSFQFSGLVPIGTGTVVIPLSLFNATDLTDIQQIRFFVSGVNSTRTVSFARIWAIPEPSTALLLGAGLAGLAVRRRR